MDACWPVTVVVLLALIERTFSNNEQLLEISVEDLPLTKSFGLSAGIKSNTLEDARINQEYIEHYQEMLRASQESYDKVNGEDDEPRRKDGRRQRHIYQIKVNSPVGKRRARSQAQRKDKLNSQSLRSHVEHTRQSSLERHLQDSTEY